MMSAHRLLQAPADKLAPVQGSCRFDASNSSQLENSRLRQFAIASGGLRGRGDATGGRSQCPSLRLPCLAFTTQLVNGLAFSVQVKLNPEVFVENLIENLHFLRSAHDVARC